MQIKSIELENKIEQTEPQNIVASLEEKKQARERLEFIKYQYEKQLQAAKEKLQQKQSDVWISILIFFVAIVIDSGFSIMLKQPAGALLAMAWEIWVASIALFVAVFKVLVHMIKKIMDYNIHNETPMFGWWQDKYDVITLKEEQRFCAWKINEIDKMSEEVNGMERERLLAVMEYPYTEKRADTNVFFFFEQNKVLCNIVMIVLGAFVIMVS